MKLLPIEAETSLNIKFGDNPECLDVLNVYPDYYRFDEEDGDVWEWEYQKDHQPL